MRLKFALFLLCALPAAANTRLALSDGEVFTYKVSWAIVMGAGEIQIVAKADPSGPAPRLRVLTTTATRGLARLLMRFDAKAESLFDLGTGRLLALSESSQQNDKHAEHEVTFDYGKKQAVYSIPGANDQPHAFAMPPGDPMDLITSLIETRVWDLKVGEKREALVLFDDEFYELTIHAARMEKVRTPMGTFNTLVLEPRMENTAPKGMFKKGSTVRVWIEQDDERHLPVKFEVEFKIGTGVATLTGYEPPLPTATALTAAVSEAAKAADGKRTAPDAKDSRP
jgi:hypothetical protein